MHERSASIHIKVSGVRCARAGVLTMLRVFNTPEKVATLPEALRGNMNQCPFFWVYSVKYGVQQVEGGGIEWPGDYAEIYEDDDFLRRVTFYDFVMSSCSKDQSQVPGFYSDTTARLAALMQKVRPWMLFGEESKTWQIAAHDDLDGGWIFDIPDCLNTFEPTGMVTA
jgi:hypothetical protein